MFTVEEKEEILESLRKIRQRHDELSFKVSNFEKAFPKNDLSDPDIDGHRKDHISLREQEKLIHEYKVDATKKILWSAIVFVGLIFLTGFTEQVKEVFK